eukprot:scaffold68712_cov21-Tisochrysis_lutea.AAC.1
MQGLQGWCFPCSAGQQACKDGVPPSAKYPCKDCVPPAAQGVQGWCYRGSPARVMFHMWRRATGVWGVEVRADS